MTGKANVRSMAKSCPLVVVIWHDAYGDMDPIPTEEVLRRAPYIELHRIGFLIDKTAECVKIAEEWCSAQGGWRGTHVIPIQNVKEIVYLSVKK